MNTLQKTKKPLYFGWYVCAATMFIGFVVIGVRNSFGVFVDPMSDEFAWNRTTVTIAASLGVAVNGISQPFMGQVFDRTGGRNMILITLAVLGTGTILISQTNNVFFLVFMFGIVVSMAQSGPALSNAAALMARWFRRKRGTAISINSAAISLGGLIMVPFAMYLLQATDNWRLAWVIIGTIVLCTLPMAFLFVHERPEDRGLFPDGDPDPAEVGSTPRRSLIPGPLTVESWRAAFTSAPIWQLSGSYFVCGMTTTVLAVHFIPFAMDDRGVSGTTAATIFGYMMGLNIIGVVGAGLLSDKIGGTKNLLALVYLIRGLAYILLVSIDSVLGMWIFATVAGFSWIATVPLTSSLTAEVYGTKAMGTISGISFMFHSFGGALSIFLAARLFDITGAYTIPFALVGAMLFPAAISAFSIKERKYSARYQAPVAIPAAGD